MGFRTNCIHKRIIVDTNANIFHAVWKFLSNIIKRYIYRNIYFSNSFMIINNHSTKFDSCTFDITCLNLSPSQQCIYPFIEVTANSDRLPLKHIARTLSAVLHFFFIRDFEYTNEGISEETTCKTGKLLY